MMINEQLYVTAVAIRALFLVLFCGAYLWFILAFRTGVKLLPPPQRIELFRQIEKRFIIVTWLFLVILTIAGLGTFYLTGTSLDLNTILSTPKGIILGLETIMTLLLIISNALIHFVFLPRTKGAEISVAESGDKSLKWLTARNSEAGLKAISYVSAFSMVNIALGIIAIALGVVFSNL